VFTRLIIEENRPRDVHDVDFECFSAKTQMTM